MCSWLLSGEQGAKKKAQAGTDTGGMERRENIDGGFKCACCCSCYVVGRSCSACRQAPVCSTRGLAVQLRLQCQFTGRQNLASLSWQKLMDCRTLGEKRVFLIIPELCSSFGPRLLVYHKSRILLTHGEMLFCRHERQVEIFGASLLFGDFYKSTTPTFSRASFHVPPRVPHVPSGIPVFKTRKRMKAQ